MIKKQRIEHELYVWILCPIKRRWDLLYKRWLDRDYGVVMGRLPFNAREVDKEQNAAAIKSNNQQ